MNLLPSITVESLFNESEINLLKNLITKRGEFFAYKANNGKYKDNTIAEYNIWNYNSDENKDIKDILDNKLYTVFSKNIFIPDSHILTAIIPYNIHTDYVHTEKIGYRPSYSIIIPLDNYNSQTVIFNEYQENSNELDDFKKIYTGEVALRIDPKFCAKNLSHLNPSDLKYLTIKEIFNWTRGSLFAFDRRYFHCSDNFVKKGVPTKQAIILWAQE